MKLVSLFLLLSMSSFIWANDDKQKEKENACNLYDQIAEKVMTYRQTGAPMSGLYNKDFGSIDRNKIVRGMLVEAYAKPKYQSSELKKNEVNEFRNHKFLECIRSY